MERSISVVKRPHRPDFLRHHTSLEFRNPPAGCQSQCACDQNFLPNASMSKISFQKKPANEHVYSLRYSKQANVKACCSIAGRVLASESNYPEFKRLSPCLLCKMKKIITESHAVRVRQDAVCDSTLSSSSCIQ